MTSPGFPVSRRAVLRTASIGALMAVAGTEAVANAAVPSRSPVTGPLPDQQRYFGLFREVADQSTVPASAFADYGAAPASVMWFDNWGRRAAFPVATAEALWRRNVLPHFTWEPWDPALALTDPNQIRLDAITAGQWDDYIAARGREFARYGKPLIVRWGHEFNGNWYPWAVATNNQDPQAFVRAYRRVHDIVRAQGAHNVQWCWAYNNGASPAADWNNEALAYPGGAYVDWIGIDGYNWGFGPSWDPTVDHWTSFVDTFAGAYARARAIDPGKPVMLPEFASSEDGGSKRDWVAAMIAELTAGRFPNLRLLTWFDIDKEERWSLTPSLPGLRELVGSGDRRRWATAAGCAAAAVPRTFRPLPE
jgi:hypothetical protein